MRPVLKSLIAAAFVEGVSFALFALGGFGPCGPSNPLGFAALLLNIFPSGLGAALVLNALDGRVRPELLDGPAVPILMGVVQLGFYWLLFSMLFKRRGKSLYGRSEKLGLPRADTAVWQEWVISSYFDSNMQTQTLKTSLVVAAVAFFAVGQCHGEDRCAGVAMSETQSLAGLPSGLRQPLPPEGGRNGIADRGGRFNDSDVVTRWNRDTPMRRFTLGAVGATCAVIADEYGGIAHGFEESEYRLVDGMWHSVEHVWLIQEPKSMSDLLTTRLSRP